MSGLLMRACTDTASSVQLESPRSMMSATALSKICSRRLPGAMRGARLFTGIDHPRGQLLFAAILRETLLRCGQPAGPIAAGLGIKFGIRNRGTRPKVRHK